ncbi:MAG: UDP-N-acetylmuramoyl-tripeptide--D-alanyl-D-alanine ligase [Bacteroidales bacterium]|jgi:UDP-N-acetylmuramoyl-tripeptide--D-alanyl-D-alanine ligase|nr:UDP-N-acetylmuramoyl-tripeptide--D-alanyl-D-alanine ligase [Bacteroidales bacterium]
MQTDQLYQWFVRYPKIVTDSRQNAEGGIFFALQGEHFDGNQFAAKALENGAMYAVVDDPGAVKDERYLPVENVLTSLQHLAQKHRQQFNIPVIAVTGTNGKTTTKELLKSVLSARFKTLATTGNLNNHIGVPLTLLQMCPQTQIAVIEMGANHRHEIKNLCHIALPTHGLITNIGKAHLEGFGGEEGVKLAKKELYDYLDEYGGTVFYRESNPLLTKILSGMQVRKISYESVCKGTVLSADPYLRMLLTMDGEKFEVQTQIAGSYNDENVMAAACAGRFFSVPPLQIVASIAGYCPQNNRSQILHTPRNKLFLDDYNANPSSMNASLCHFFGQPVADKMVIVGDMLELGKTSPEEHRAVVDLLLSHPEVESIVVGETFSQVARHTGIASFKNTPALLQWLKENPPQGKFILIKASRGMKLEQLQEWL